MTDPRLLKLADVLVNYSIQPKRGDWIAIQADIPALPLATAVYEKVVQAGANPMPVFNTDVLDEIFYKNANDDQLKWISPLERMLSEEVDARIVLRAPSNTRTLTGVDPTKQQNFQFVRRDLMKARMQRSAEGKLKWVLTNFPTEAYAQEADMSLREFEDFVYAATAADQDDPVAYWQHVHHEQARLVDWLKGKNQVQVRGRNIDMTLSIKDRVFINADGDHNMPDGEIFTGPVEDSVNGWVNFTYPAIRQGRMVEGVRFEFKDGKVVSAKADKNEDFLLKNLDSDAGSRYLGEFAIGTNYNIKKFTRSILYDEKIGGSLHMAVGAGYPQSGSKNESSVHWDFITDMTQDSEILVDGELFYKNGQFQV